MTNAPRDGSGVPAGMGVLNTDGTTLVPIAINESTGAVKVNTTDPISFTMTPMSPRDANKVNVWLFMGSDGLTYPWVVDSNGAVLITYS